MATPGAWSVTADDVKAATSRANFSMGDFGEPSRTPLTDTVYALNLANKAATGYTQFEAMRQHAQGLEVLLAEAGIRISDGNAWIPVTERLPDPIDSYVLVSGIDPRVYRKRELHVCYVDDDDQGYLGPVSEWRWMTEAGNVIAEVTHWKPLPEGPK